jgi:hypothetical protein
MELEIFKIEQHPHKLLYLIQATLTMKISTKHHSQIINILDRTLL